MAGGIFAVLSVSLRWIIFTFFLFSQSNAKSSPAVLSLQTC
jgi:hypothetical protein